MTVEFTCAKCGKKGEGRVVLDEARRLALPPSGWLAAANAEGSGSVILCGKCDPSRRRGAPRVHIRIDIGTLDDVLRGVDTANSPLAQVELLKRIEALVEEDGAILIEHGGEESVLRKVNDQWVRTPVG